MIASTMVRASAKGLPLRPVGRGSMSAIIDHWASESTWNLDIWPVSQDGRYIFVRHALAHPMDVQVSRNDPTYPRGVTMSLVGKEMYVCIGERSPSPPHVCSGMARWGI